MLFALSGEAGIPIRDKTTSTLYRCFFVFNAIISKILPFFLVTYLQFVGDLVFPFAIPAPKTLRYGSFSEKFAVRSRSRAVFFSISCGSDMMKLKRFIQSCICARLNPE